MEGYIDALAVTATGRSVVAVGGTNASEEQLAELDKFGNIYILPDRDDRGSEAATTWARALYPAARICPADYGAEDCNDVADLFAVEEADKIVEHLNRLISASRDILDIEMEITKEIEDRRARLIYAAKNIAPSSPRSTPTV